MDEISKTARQKLATPSAGEHLDANLLSGFAENALSSPERKEVLRHLSTCEECREIVALAQPQEQERYKEAAVGFAAAPQPRMQRFTFRWGTLAACAVIVVAILWGIRERKESSLAKTFPEGTFVADARQNSSANADSKLKTESRELGARLEPDSAGRKQAAKITDSISTISAPLANEKAARHAPGKNTMQRKEEVADARIQPGPPPPPPSTSESANLSVAIKPQQQVAGAQAQTATPPSAPTMEESVQTGGQPMARVADEHEAKKIPATRGKGAEKDKRSAEAFGTLSKTVAQGSGQGALLGGVTRWTLSDGQLRRSDDTGSTWEVVSLSAEAIFRALSVMGPELWVGGKKGVLYHSSDNGEHWVHVIPSEGKEVLSEDIVRLEFADPENGKLITPRNEWITTNGGKTWQKLTVR